MASLQSAIRRLPVLLWVLCLGCNPYTLPYAHSPEADVYCHRYTEALKKLPLSSITSKTADRNYSLFATTRAMAALEQGQLPLALDGLRRATSVYGASVGRDKGIESTFLSENIKFFKGGVHEKTLTLALQGLVYEMLGDYDSARASYRIGLLADSVVSPPPHDEDNGLLYYLLARLHTRHQPEPDTERILWDRVAGAARQCSYCAPERAKRDNALFVVGLGRPVLRTRGATRSIDAYKPVPTRTPWCDVRINGQSVGRCALVFNGAQQAQGADPTARRALQAAKGIAVVSATPELDGLTGGMWSKLGGDELDWADLRAVPIFPGYVGIVSAAIPEGTHTLEIIGLDMAGQPVPETTYRRRFFAVEPSGDTIVFARLAEHRQNAHPDGRSMQCGTPNELDYFGDDARFQSTYEKFWPSRTQPRYQAADYSRARVKACLPGVECPSSVAPVLVGGKDYSPPDARRLESWKAAGHVDASTTLAALADRYRQRGFILPGDADPRSCGEHVAVGGRCLIPPAAGSPLFDFIISGGEIEL